MPDRVLGNWLRLVAAALCIAGYVRAADYDRHVFFDNSLSAERHYSSEGKASAPSTLTLLQDRLPVERRVFFTPPNSIRLEWRSQPSGGWEASLKLEAFRNRPLGFQGDSLVLWCFSPKPVPASALPRIQLSDADGAFTAVLEVGPIIGDLAAERWTRWAIPFSRFRSVSMKAFNGAWLDRVSFVQGDADAHPHTLYIDEIRVDSQSAKSPRIEPPKDLSAKGYDRHIELSWSPSAGAERYTIYRSANGRDYSAVGTQRPEFNRYSDFPGEIARPSYRITASSGDYRESPPSQAVSAATRAFTDEELLTMLQEANFRYYWEGAHPDCGMALENIPGDENIVALGASGFGIMAVLAGAERGFISRGQALERISRVAAFLAKADRYHGVWPHFLDGRSGRTIPVFGKYDNGGDLVETAFLMQGLLAARQYFNRDTPTEKVLFQNITHLWETVEWDWYRRYPDSDFLYWHWSPEYSWHINHKLIGFNEAMIVYLLAIASPTHAVPASMYYSGWASQSDEAAAYRRGWGGTDEGERYANGHSYFGTTLDVGVGRGGPLFFTHYSFLGFDARGLRDRYTNYFENNRKIARINLAYCAENPKHFPGYGPDAWGLTASDGPTGYSAHEPKEALDDGTLTPTGALASFPYAPEASMNALRHFYRDLGPRLWGPYGFRDAFNLKSDWYAPIFMGLNQAPITVMIENHRSGLLWKLFMANPEIASALRRIGFTHQEQGQDR